MLKVVCLLRVITEPKPPGLFGRELARPIIKHAIKAVIEGGVAAARAVLEGPAEHIRHQRNLADAKLGIKEQIGGIRQIKNPAEAMLLKPSRREMMVP